MGVYMGKGVGKDYKIIVAEIVNVFPLRVKQNKLTNIFSKTRG